MIRPTTPADTDALMALAEASGLFEPSQTVELVEMLGQHFAGDSPDYWLTDEDNEPVGVAYVAPERMTEGVFNCGSSRSAAARSREEITGTC